MSEIDSMPVAEPEIELEDNAGAEDVAEERGAVGRAVLKTVEKEEDEFEVMVSLLLERFKNLNNDIAAGKEKFWLGYTDNEKNQLFIDRDAAFADFMDYLGETFTGKIHTVKDLQPLWNAIDKIWDALGDIKARNMFIARFIEKFPVMFFTEARIAAFKKYLDSKFIGGPEVAKYRKVGEYMGHVNVLDRFKRLIDTRRQEREEFIRK